MDDRKFFVVPESHERGRADKILSSILEPYKSRSSISQLIKAGCVTCNSHLIRPSTILEPGDRIELFEICEPELDPEVGHTPEIRIIYENEEILVVDKPSGLVTHPGAGRHSTTLMDLVLKIRPEIMGVGEENRWGIAHRLDKDTSGVMVIAKTDSAHRSLSAQFKEHSIHRVYRAIVRGNPKTDHGIIDLPIGRDSKDRKKMCTRPVKGRIAESHWKVLERYKGFAFVEVRPKTGRTHQIRAHLASVSLPVLGDKVYGAATKKQIRSGKILAKLLKMVQRQALHAAELGISPGGQNETHLFLSDLPEDMQNALDMLRDMS